MTATVLPKPFRKNDHFLLRSMKSETPLVEVYEQSEVEIVLGAACKPERDLFVDRCRDDGVPIRHRRGGGGAVVLSPGMIIILAAGPLSDRFGFQRIFEGVNQRLTAALREAGIGEVVHRGACDLAVEDRKILGGSLYLSRDRFFYQGSLLYDPDLELMDRYLKFPANTPEYRRGRGHSEFCTSLTRLGIDESMADLCRFINQEFNGSRWNGF
jgi:lipoate-protein ligase A